MFWKFKANMRCEIYVLLLIFTVTVRSKFVFDLSHGYRPDMIFGSKSDFAFNRTSATAEDPNTPNFCVSEDAGTRLNGPQHVMRHREMDHTRRYTHQYPAEDLVCRAYIFDIRKMVADHHTPLPITTEYIKQYEEANREKFGKIPENSCVIILTDRSALFTSTQPDGKGFYDPSWAYLTPEALTFLIAERNIQGVATDCPSIDLLPVTMRKNHIQLMERNLLYIEVINLQPICRKEIQIPVTGGILFVMVMNIKDGFGGPVRAFLMNDPAINKLDGEWVDLGGDISDSSMLPPGGLTPLTRETRNVKENDDGGPKYVVWYATLCMHEKISTHIDAPRLTKETLKDDVTKTWTVDEIPPEMQRCPCVRFDIRGKVKERGDYRLTITDIRAHETAHGTIPNSAIVALWTGGGTLWELCNQLCEYESNAAERTKCIMKCMKQYTGEDSSATPRPTFKFPGYTPEAAAYLITNYQVMGLGTDALLVDGSVGSMTMDVHKVASANNVYMIQNMMGLEKITAANSFIVVGPTKVVGGLSAPARVFAYNPGSNIPCNSW